MKAFQWSSFKNQKYVFYKGNYKCYFLFIVYDAE
jgi:hypothetical protein